MQIRKLYSLTTYVATYYDVIDYLSYTLGAITCISVNSISELRITYLL